jgi:hypothetical protein
MSWTIETNNEETVGMKKLFEAVDKAWKRDIIMLCSASDQGSASKPTCYPGKWNKCIRIGASTGTGEKCAWVHGEDIDFIFPGENVPFDRSNEMPPTYHSGSSVATAVAAGTASLLLYCNKLVAATNGGAKNVNDLKNLTAMTNAFETMSLATNNNCPRLSHFFDKKFVNWTWALDRKKALDSLSASMKKIKVRYCL